MFGKVLIANRGEIACRIIRTATRMGISTIAVYSEPDKNALHVQQADEAYLIGPAPATKSYLNQEAIIQTALNAGAEAIHPGYGFLSENPEFAKRCQKANLVFIGPPPEVIREMAIKSRAKSLLHQAGIPVTPGYHGTVQNSETLEKEAQTLGFPLLIKADRGGGGKGIRLVNDFREFKDALLAAQREAAGAFAQGDVILEKYLKAARHIEVQIFRDSFGNTVHLFERDCSLQRRHQKIIEESPAPNLDEKLRTAIHNAATTVAKTIDYVGAGTVEFLVDKDGKFYFMEVNTRLQVEHPVTEMITGQDLVEWQLRVAAGEPLPLLQSEIQQSGHAIEARIYAEDPNNNFMPSSGAIYYFSPPATAPNIRFENGIQSGDKVTPYYDPILSKLIIHGKNRAEAIRQLHLSLTDFQLAGIATNIVFLKNITEHHIFTSGTYTTYTIDSDLNSFLPEERVSDEILATAALYVLLRDEQHSIYRAQMSSEPNSPWNCTRGYRLNDGFKRIISLMIDGRIVQLHTAFDGAGYHIHLPSKTLYLRGTLDESDKLVLQIENRQMSYQTASLNDNLTLFDASSSFTFIVSHDTQEHGTGTATDTDFRSPLPATISTIFITPGTQVNKGDALLSLEAMKMEYTIKAPFDGEVEDVLCYEGGQVDEGDLLIRFTQIR